MLVGVLVGVVVLVGSPVGVVVVLGVGPGHVDEKAGCDEDEEDEAECRGLHGCLLSECREFPLDALEWSESLSTETC